MLLTLKDQEYATYIKNHQKNIQIAFYEFVNHNHIYDLIDEYDIDLNNLEQRILNHDESKWSNIEFYGYRQFYYPLDNELPSKILLDRAWIHHYSINDHHPEYWIINRKENNELILNEEWDKLKSYEMSIESILEMLCDWIAMSLNFHSSLLTWYYSEGYKYPFAEQTKEIVNKIIKFFKQHSEIDYRISSYIVS